MAWVQKTKEELAQSKAIALGKVQSGAFPAGIRVKVGDHTLTTRPSGVSAGGGVSYSISPGIYQLGEHRVRINKMSMTVLADKETAMAEGELEGEIL